MCVCVGVRMCVYGGGGCECVLSQSNVTFMMISMTTMYIQ